MRKLVFLVAVAVAVAGCTALPSKDTEEKPKKIEITGPECTVNGQPCSAVQVRKYSNPRVSLQVANYGESKVEIKVGDNGRQVLVSGCNIYKLTGKEGFQAWKRSTAMKKDVTDDPKQKVVLKPDQRLNMVWNFKLKNIDISRLGTTCPLDFALTFNQTLNTSRQIQVKESEDIPDASPLSSSTTGIWPVRLRIDSPSRVIEGEGRSFVARAYLENVGTGEIKDIGLPDADYGINLSFEGVKVKDGKKQQSCTKKPIRMYGAGERKGESFREVCQFTPENVDGSQVFRLKAETEYRYRFDLPEVEISVVPVRGG